jgi:anti-sigma B factor antagonist
MLLTTRSAGDAVIVDLSGRLTMGEPAAAFREAIRRELDEGRRKFVVNLAGCEFLDSAGMGELATALVRIHNAGGQLRLLKLTKRVHDLLRIARLQPVFERHEHEAAALESMR